MKCSSSPFSPLTANNEIFNKPLDSYGIPHLKYVDNLFTNALKAIC